jgi:hypothetical protein
MTSQLPKTSVSLQPNRQANRRRVLFTKAMNTRSIICFNSQVEGSGSRLRRVLPSVLQIAEVLMKKNCLISFPKHLSEKVLFTP